MAQSARLEQLLLTSEINRKCAVIEFSRSQFATVISSVCFPFTTSETQKHQASRSCEASVGAERSWRTADDHQQPPWSPPVLPAMGIAPLRSGSTLDRLSCSHPQRAPELR